MKCRCVLHHSHGFGPFLPFETPLAPARMAGEPDDMVWTEEKASSMLATLHADPAKKDGLLNLLSSSTNLETQIIAREMGAIADRVAKLEQQVT